MTDPKFMTPPHRRAYLTHLQPLQGNGQLPPRTDLHLDSSTRTSE